MSQQDLTSLDEGEAPPTSGCYKQYEHAMTNRIPESTDPSQFQSSPQKERRYSGEGSDSPEKRLLLNPDPTPEKKTADKQLYLEQLPSEFECCFCTFKGYKEFIDAEQLMPMSTSDLRQPVCVELACLQRRQGPAPKALPEATPNSLDSPEGDIACEIDSSNLYVNPLDGSGSGGGGGGAGAGTSDFGGVRKSASGDGSVLCSKGAHAQGEGSPHGSRGSLVGAVTPGSGTGSLAPAASAHASRTSLPQPLEDAHAASDDAKPKHRKARFQQEWTEEEKRPPRGIATRIINHHILFGKNGRRGGGGGWSLEGEGRARSILKNKEARGTDSELLLQDAASQGANGDSGSESSPIRLKDFKGQNHKAGAQERDKVAT